jgi:hypothetical protein
MSRPSVATQLVDLAHGAGVELFRTPDGEPFAVVPADSHQEIWPVRSSGFRLWLRRLYFSTTRGTANSQALQDALATLEGEALFDGNQEDVHLRVAEWNGSHYLDLADPYWRVVEIGAAGWRVLDHSPVRFHRPKGLLGLPVPVSAGSLDGLREFLTVDDDGWRLVAGWLVATLRPDRPFPILALHGEQGSAKSTQAKMLRRMVDPNVADLRPCPREEYDLFLAAKNAWVIGFDNVSEIKPWLSDALCRVSTGIGFGRRQLYTDGDEYLLSVKRPIIVNGIEEVAVKGDFVDRAIVQCLPVIEEDQRREEDELWSAFEAAHPVLLGALLDVIAGALNALPGVHLDRKPRMADFCRWAVAAEASLGWKPGAFLRSYRRNQGRAVATTLEASLLVDPLRALLAQQPVKPPATKPEPKYEGRVGELLRQLREQVDERTVRDDNWPKDAIRLAGELRRLAPALRRIGINVEFPRTGKRRVIVEAKEKERGNQRDERDERDEREGRESQGTSGPDGGPDGPDGPDDSPTFSHGGSNGTEREPGREFETGAWQVCARCGGRRWRRRRNQADECAICIPEVGCP